MFGNYQSEIAGFKRSDQNAASHFKFREKTVFFGEPTQWRTFIVDDLNRISAFGNFVLGNV